MAETTTQTGETGEKGSALSRLWRRMTGARGKASSTAPQVKAGGVTTQSDIGWSHIGGNRFGGYYSGSATNWVERAGVLWENPAVSLAIGYIFDKVVEPQLALMQMMEGGEEEQVKKPAGALSFLLELLDKPNPEYDGATLRQITSASYKLTGNAYWVKVRGGRGATGAVVELWYVPHWQMSPVAPEDGGPTREYERVVYVKGKAVKTRYPREDVVHFRRGMDPMNPRCGLDLFRAILRELVSDSQIATYTAAILTNMGVTGGIVGSNDPENPLGPSERDELKRLLDDRTTGDNAGSWLVSSLPLKVDAVGASPQAMAIDKMGERPESRVLAAFGLNAMAIGLPSDDKKYANLRESRAMALENGVIPMLSDFAATLTQELLPEFDVSGGRSGYRLDFDYSGVRDLQPDEDKQSARFVAEFKGGIRKLSEARAGIGLMEDTAGPDGYLWQLAPSGQAKSAGDASAGNSDNAGGSTGGSDDAGTAE